MNHDSNHLEDPKLPEVIAKKTTQGFKVPALYFENLTDRIMDRVEKNVLVDDFKDNPFKVPQAYFENFSPRLIDQLQTTKTSRTITTSFKRMRMWSAAAAVVLILSLAGIYFYIQQKPVDYLADVSENELLEYVSVYAEDFDRFSLAYVMSEEDLKAIELFDHLDELDSDVLIELYE